MIIKIPLASLSCKKRYWDEFEGEYSPSAAQTKWIVSDLNSKQFLQGKLLEKHKILWPNPVWRASDFWYELFQKSHPHFKVVKAFGQKALAEEFIDSKKTTQTTWWKRPGASRTLLEFTRVVAPLLCHDMSEEIVVEAKEKFEIDNPFFFELLEASQEFYSFCLASQVVPRFLLPNLIKQREDLFPRQEKYYFDLGSGITDSEWQLIQELGVHNEIVIFEKVLPKENSLQNHQFLRLASPDAEARRAVEQVSQWIKMGIKKDKIGITSQDVSIYENLLAHDLAWEGLTLNRSLSSPLSGARFFRRLTAQLKINLHIPTPELSYLLQEAFEEITAGELKSLRPIQDLTPVFETKLAPQLQNLKAIKDSMCSGQSEGLSFSKFKEYVLKLVENFSENTRSENTGALLQILSELRQEMGYTQHSLRKWVQAWQEACAHGDMIYQRADKNGILLLDFKGVDEAPITHLIVLGAQAEKAAPSPLQNLSPEAVQFFSQLGFEFKEKRNDWTNELPWVTQGVEKVLISCAAKDQGGKVLTPSSFWLLGARAIKKHLDLIDQPENTNWQSMQSQWQVNTTAIDSLKNWPSGSALKLFGAIKNEIHHTKEIRIQLESAKVTPSQLENLWQCSFKFFASQGLRLRDDAELEIEPTPSLRGQILHGAIEKIMTRPLEEWTVKDLQNLIDELGHKQKSVTADVWPSTRARLLRVLQRFIKNEIQYLKSTKRSIEIKNEVGFKGFINLNKSKDAWTLTPGVVSQSVQGEGHSWPLSGRVDRIDILDSSKALVIDYKDRSSQLTHLKSWANQGKFQLALYSMALDSGLFPLRGKVLGAFYYSLRNLDRTKGFLLEGTLEELESQAKGATVSEEDKVRYFEEINTEISGALKKLAEGDFTPAPRNEDIEKYCQPCSWRRLCRAHHLL